MYLSIVNKTNEPQTQFERERIVILLVIPNAFAHKKAVSPHSLPLI